MSTPINNANDLDLEKTHEEIETFSSFLATPKELLLRYTHCSFCGANLHFTHITDFGKNITQEAARCPECGLKAKKSTHRLQ